MRNHLSFPEVSASFKRNCLHALQAHLAAGDVRETAEEHSVLWLLCACGEASRTCLCVLLLGVHSKVVLVLLSHARGTPLHLPGEG